MVMIKGKENEFLRFEGDRDEVVWEVLDWARVLTAWREYEIDDEDPYWVILDTQAHASEEAVDNGVPGQAYKHLTISILNEDVAKKEIQEAVLALINNRIEEPVALENIVDDGDYDPEGEFIQATTVIHAVQESKTSTKH